VAGRHARQGHVSPLVARLTDISAYVV